METRTETLNSSHSRTSGQSLNEKQLYLNVKCRAVGELAKAGRVATETLKLMGRTPGEPLTREVAREICVRTNSKAMLSGSISSLGSQYVIGLKAGAEVRCASRTGDNRFT